MAANNISRNCGGRLDLNGKIVNSLNRERIAFGMKLGF